MNALITAETFDEAFAKLGRRLLFAPEVSPRGLPCRELSPCTIGVNLPGDGLIRLPSLETNEKYAKAEFGWYLMGSNELRHIAPFENAWRRFSDDGKTVNSAYGYQILGNHPDVRINQFEWAYDKLCEDPDTRQAVININLPAHKRQPTKDFPCTVFLQYLLRDGRLNAITSMRSNDAFLGFRNDAYCFTRFQALMARRLGVKPGEYWHFASSMHLYSENEGRFREALGL